MLWSSIRRDSRSVGRRVPASTAGRAPAVTRVFLFRAASLPASFLGAWGGTGAQVEPEMDYPVLVLLTGGSEGSPVGYIDYPSFPCGGSVALVAATERQVEVVEQLEFGQESCVDGGRVRLSRRPDGALDYTWTAGDSPPDTPPAVTGVLKRRSTLAEAG